MKKIFYTILSLFTVLGLSSCIGKTYTPQTIDVNKVASEENFNLLKTEYDKVKKTTDVTSNVSISLSLSFDIKKDIKVYSDGKNQYYHLDNSLNPDCVYKQEGDSIISYINKNDIYERNLECLMVDYNKTLISYYTTSNIETILSTFNPEKHLCTKEGNNFVVSIYYNDISNNKSYLIDGRFNSVPTYKVNSSFDYVVKFTYAFTETSITETVMCEYLGYNADGQVLNLLLKDTLTINYGDFDIKEYNFTLDSTTNNYIISK